jgi:DNA polymerase III delta prime subunit
LWVERGQDDTRVRIGQIRAVQKQLYLQSSGRQVLVVADASWLNLEAQNCILRVLEEPPAGTHILLLTENPASLLATVRSRCQRINLPSLSDNEPSSEIRDLQEELTALVGSTGLEVLRWAETYRGPRAQAAAEVGKLLEAGCSWIYTKATERRVPKGGPFTDLLDAWQTLRECRKALVQRNANPQMIAERALGAINRTHHG